MVYLNYEIDCWIWNRVKIKSTYSEEKDIFMTWEAENSKEDKLPWPFSYLEMGTDWQNKKAIKAYCCWVSAESRKTRKYGTIGKLEFLLKFFPLALRYFREISTSIDWGVRLGENVKFVKIILHAAPENSFCLKHLRTLSDFIFSCFERKESDECNGFSLTPCLLFFRAS